MTFREFVIREFQKELEILGFEHVAHYVSAGLVENKQMSWYFMTYPEKRISEPADIIKQGLHDEIGKRARAMMRFRREGGIEKDDFCCIKRDGQWYTVIWSFKENKDLIRCEFGPHESKEAALCDPPLMEKPVYCYNEQKKREEKCVSLFERLN